MNLNQLTPEQLVFISTINDALVKSYDEVISSKGIMRTVELPMIGKMKSFTELTPEHIEEIKQNKRYNFGKSLQKVLHPVIDIIKESMPEMYETVVELTDMHETVEEDND
jgi:hypothetical protein